MEKFKAYLTTLSDHELKELNDISPLIQCVRAEILKRSPPPSPAAAAAQRDKIKVSPADIPHFRHLYTLRATGHNMRYGAIHLEKKYPNLAKSTLQRKLKRWTDIVHVPYAYGRVMGTDDKWPPRPV
jgi:hypothetical protein